MSITHLYVATLTQIRTALNWLPGTLASVLILLLAAVFALVAHRIVTKTFLSVPGQRASFVRAFVKRIGTPLRIFFIIAAVVTALPVAGFSSGTETVIGQVLLVCFVLLVGSTALLATRVATDSYLARFALDREDNLIARKHATQVRVLTRAADILIVLVTVASALMTFEPVRQYGLSLFASAGAASVVVGLAARPLLTNLIAGVQIAVTQPIRIEDAVIVEGEWGWVEEITSTYVVIRLWDWRRMIVPLAYFLEKPFQNWTHSSSSLIGTVFLYADYRAPVQLLRDKLTELAKASPIWDGKIVNLQVSDASEHALQIRMLVSARNAPQAWDLRCEIREKMIAWLQAEMPEILPRTRVDLAPAGTTAQTSADSFGSG